MSEHEATVDVCIGVHSMRNIGQSYLSKYYFTMCLHAAHHLAVPYQIIPAQSISSISLLHYISPLFSLPPFSSHLYQELIVFKMLVPLALLETQGIELCFELHELSGTEDRLLQEAQLEYTSILGLNAFTPIYFCQSKCAIDAVITTQLLTCRFKNILAAPKSLIYIAVEGLLISYNRLREKVGKYHKSQEIDLNLQSFPEFEDVRRLRKIRIFEQSEERQRVRLGEFQRNIPRISSCVQKLWGQHLALDNSLDIQRYRRNFINSYALQVKQSVVRETGSDTFYVDGLKICACPIGIQTVLKKEAESVQRGYQTETHLIILVHGYGASSKTLEQLQQALRYFFPHLHVATSKINQNRTDDGLEELGRRLSLQVESLVSSFKVGDNFSLSFMGHSMGGLIIRSALPFLEKYKYNMKLFVSLGSPHLGYFYHNSKLTKLGMWAYNFLKGSSSMGMLLMKNENNYRSTYLYQLSNSPALEWFQEVMLYAAVDDLFVSEESALLLSNQTIERDCERGVEEAVVWVQMKQNLERTISKGGLCKLRVNFEKENLMNEGSVGDELLGRRNHINLATSKSFIAALILSHSHLL